MAVEKFTDARIFFAGHNLTGQSNSVTLNRSAEILDAPVFGNTTRINAPGLFDYSADVAGFWDTSSDAVIEPLFDELGQITNSLPLILYPKNTENEVAYTFMATQESLELMGTLGDLQPYSGTFRVAREEAAQNYHEPVQGYVGATFVLRSSAGNGTGVQAGALTSAQEMVFASMITAADTLTTMDFILESDDDSGFATATTRATHTFTAANSADMTTVAGPITDDWWRVRWTLTGTSFSGVAVFGIAG
jgi:hypothetical protein